MPPLIHQKIFGGEAEGKEWAGRFYFQPSSSSWTFYYLEQFNHEYSDDTSLDIIVPELTGNGLTPSDAFEETVKKFIYFNQGEESPTLKELLPQLRSFFNPDGTVRMESLLA